MGEVHALRIKSPYKLLHVEYIKITNKPNEHGRLYLKCLIDDSINFKYSIEASTKDEITVYEENEINDNSEADINKVDESRSTVLFNGLIESIKTTNENGIYYLEIEGISKTSILDVEKKSRSFQNLNMTYEELIALILKDYGDLGFIQNVGNGLKLKGPIFQYNETDWELLLRICRELNGVLYCDIINLNNLFYFGISEGKTYEIKDDISYKACKDLKAFYKAGGYDEGYHDTDYFYYEINTRKQYDLGDKIYFKQKDVYVTEYAACKYQDEIIYKYRLCRKNGVWFTKLYNSLICGASLEGKVLATRGEEVKLHLDIDKEQNEDEAAWFKYAPPTGNVMYSMPIVGTSARLYFPDETGREPLVSGCVRNNGSSCAKTSDTTKRYFGTEHGSEVEMTPSALNIKGGSASPISISIDDNKGITITSPKKLTLNADSEIIMKTPKSVKINGVSQINAQKTNTESGFSFETDLHFLSDNVIKEGSSCESYPDFEDEPEEGQMPEPEPPAEEKGFNLLGTLAVFAVAAVAVVASVATFGVGAVLIGAAIGAAISVASTAIGDAISGKRSSLGTYIKNAFVGAVSGAIFGPFGAFESLGGMMAFGGLSGMGESLLNQAMEGKFSLGQTLFDGLIGTAAAGLLHGAGKLISKVSPYIKNGIGKVLGKLSSGAKSILSKVSGKLDDVLGAFSKTSRELFDKVANKVGNVFRNIKNSAQDLADRLSGKFNEITSKIDDALHSMPRKVDGVLNSIYKWMDNNLQTLGLVPQPVEGILDNTTSKEIKPLENIISKMSGFKSTSELPVKGYTGFKNFVEVKYNDVVATGKDAFGKTTKWVIPKGYDSVDDFLNKVSDKELLDMGYASRDEFRETVANLEKYLNKKPRNTIRNQSLANSKHPVTGTSYDVLGLPTFDEQNIKFKCNLKESNIIDTDSSQFKDCTKQLKEKINNGEIPKKLFTKQQLEDIEAEKEIISQLTWHHDKVTGKMQLVDYDVHSKTGHLGGNNIWGEGVRNNIELQDFYGN